MITPESLTSIVTNKIRQDEKLGILVGGSGDLANSPFNIIKISDPKPVSKGYEVKYEYKTTVEAEFSYSPDNPPIVYHHNKSIIVDKEGKVISESEKKTKVSGISDQDIPDMDFTLDFDGDEF